jgi:hypothetical protein
MHARLLTCLGRRRLHLLEASANVACHRRESIEPLGILLGCRVLWWLHLHCWKRSPAVGMWRERSDSRAVKCSVLRKSSGELGSSMLARPVWILVHMSSDLCAPSLSWVSEDSLGDLADAASFVFQSVLLNPLTKL